MVVARRMCMLWWAGSHLPASITGRMQPQEVHICLHSPSGITGERFVTSTMVLTPQRGVARSWCAQRRVIRRGLAAQGAVMMSQILGPSKPSG